jgi:hypothetical protein
VLVSNFLVGALIGVYEYILYTGDFEWLFGVWSNYTKGVSYMAGKVDSSGFANLSTNDWGRQGMGGHNSEGNAIYYRVFPNLTFLSFVIRC